MLGVLVAAAPEGLGIDMTDTKEMPDELFVWEDVERNLCFQSRCPESFPTTVYRRADLHTPEAEKLASIKAKIREMYIHGCAKLTVAAASGHELGLEKWSSYLSAVKEFQQAVDALKGG